MGMGDVQLLRAVDEVVGRLASVRATFTDAGQIADPLLFGAARGGARRARLLARSSMDAATAERLLAPVARQERGLEPLLDAIRGVRAVQGQARPTTNAISLANGRLRTELVAAKAWKRVQGMDDAARTELLDRVRAGTPHELTADDWLALSGIVGDDVDRTLVPGLPRRLGSTSNTSIRDLGLYAQDWNYDGRQGFTKFFVGNDYWDAWRASDIDPAVRRARIDELLTGAPGDRTREEWRELTGLLNAGSHDVVDHPWFPGVRVEVGARNSYLHGYEDLERLRPSIDSASPGQLEAARRQLLGRGEIDPLATSILERGQLDRIGITGSEAAAVRLRHLEPATPDTARVWLLDARAAMERADLDGPGAALRDSANKLIDRNLARIDGDRRWRLRDGYSNHPDYAEVGRVRSTWQLLEQLTAPAAQPAPAAAPSATAPVAATDTLMW